MATTRVAKSISSADLAKLTQAAVRAATRGVSGRFVGTGPTLGFIARGDLGAVVDIELATAITTAVTANATAAGIGGLKLKPVVLKRPGGITLGFFPTELNITVR